MFALVQRPTSPVCNSFEIMPGLYAAFETDVVDRIIESEPERAKFMAGLVAWSADELLDEIEWRPARRRCPTIRGDAQIRGPLGGPHSPYQAPAEWRSRASAIGTRYRRSRLALKPTPRAT
jgi:hypothetical protein